MEQISKAQLVVALDVADSKHALEIADRLSSLVSWYKVGLELFSAAGPTILDELHKKGKKVFLDLKLHDIPNTVARTVACVAKHGVSLLTIHAQGGRAMLEAAVQAARCCSTPSPRLVAVTVLTSLAENDLFEIGVTQTVRDHILLLSRMALATGIDGLVCAVDEAAMLRRAFGPAVILVTPGVRPKGARAADQKRTSTPTEAVRAGSDFIVVGRPITEAPDPVLAAQTILEEISLACPPLTTPK